MTQVEAARLILKQGGCNIENPRCDQCPFGSMEACINRWGQSIHKTGLSEEQRIWLWGWLSEHGEEGGEGKPVDHFEVGKWYKWVGPNAPSAWGIMYEHSERWETGRALYCTKANYDLNDYAFEGLGTDSWAYNGTMQNFREVPPPSESDGRMEKGPGVLQGTLVEVKINPSQICRIMGLPPSLGVVALEGSLVSQRRRMRASLISRI